MPERVASLVLMTRGVSVGTFGMVYWRYEQPLGHRLFQDVSIGSDGSLTVVVYEAMGIDEIEPSVFGLFSVYTSTLTPWLSTPLEKSQTYPVSVTICGVASEPAFVRQDRLGVVSP